MPLAEEQATRRRTSTAICQIHPGLPTLLSQFFLRYQLPAFRVPTWQVADVEPGLGALDWGHNPPTLSSVASASPIVTKILASGIGNRMLGSVMWSECAEAPPL